MKKQTQKNGHIVYTCENFQDNYYCLKFNNLAFSKRELKRITDIFFEFKILKTST